MPATVVDVCISQNKGERKTPVEAIVLSENHGVAGDAHAGEWHRQVSLLAIESIAKMRALGLDVSSGDFAENITTSGIDLVALPIGTRLALDNAVLEVTQIGKECLRAAPSITRQATVSCPRRVFCQGIARG